MNSGAAAARSHTTAAPTDSARAERSGPPESGASMPRTRVRGELNRWRRSCPRGSPARRRSLPAPSWSWCWRRGHGFRPGRGSRDRVFRARAPSRPRRGDRTSRRAEPLSMCYWLAADCFGWVFGHGAIEIANARRIAGPAEGLRPGDARIPSLAPGQRVALPLDQQPHDRLHPCVTIADRAISDHRRRRPPSAPECRWRRPACHTRALR